MPKCGFLSPSPPSSSNRSAAQLRDACPRMYVATRAGSLALYSLSPAVVMASAAGTGGTEGECEAACPGIDGGEWHAYLTKEVMFCRPLRQFTEHKLNLGEFSSGASSSRSRRNSDTLSSPRVPVSTSAPQSPCLAPVEPAIHRPSPELGPKSVPCRPCTPSLDDAASALGNATGANCSEPSKWLSSVELTTHAPRDVPLWLCPQLSFFTYPGNVSANAVNAQIRSGCLLLGRKSMPVARVEQPGEVVSYNIGTSQSIDCEEHLARHLGGALGSSAQNGVARRPVTLGPSDMIAASAAACAGPVNGHPSVSVAAAWTSCDDRPQADCQKWEEVEDDWLKA